MMGANYKKPNQEMQINMIPGWMNTTLNICKYFLYVVPFICCSIAMLIEGTPTSQSYILTAVYCLSLLKLIDLTDM